MTADIDRMVNVIEKDDVELFKDFLGSKKVTQFSFSADLGKYNPVLKDNPPVISVVAFYGAENCLNYLINKSTSLTQLDNQSRSIQYFAVAGGNMPIIKLLSSNNLEFTEYTHLAAGLGNLQILKYLINELNCDPTTIDAVGSTLLHNVAIGGDTKTADWLIKSGFIDINSKDQLGILTFLHFNNTPLHLAAFHGNSNVVKLLLKAPGIDLNPVNIFLKIHFFHIMFHIKFFLSKSSI